MFVCWFIGGWPVQTWTECYYFTFLNEIYSLHIVAMHASVIHTLFPVLVLRVSYSNKTRIIQLHCRLYNPSCTQHTKLHVKPCPNGKCFMTKHDQTLFGDQTCWCCTEWPNGISYVWQTVRITHKGTTHKSRWDGFLTIWPLKSKTFHGEIDIIASLRDSVTFSCKHSWYFPPSIFDLDFPSFYALSLHKLLM